MVEYTVEVERGERFWLVYGISSQQARRRGTGVS